MQCTDILIVDDSSTSRMIVQRCFQMAGFREAGYLFAENGLEALDILLGTTPVSLVVTDLNMPKLDGENFIKKMRSEPRLQTVPVVVVSSMDSALVGEELKQLGVLGILQKPISPQQVMHVMEAQR